MSFVRKRVSARQEAHFWFHEHPSHLTAPAESRSSCAAVAEPASGTIRRWDASPRRRWTVPATAEPVAPVESILGGLDRLDRLRAALRKLPGCSRRRWPPGRQVLAARRRLPGSGPGAPRRGPTRRQRWSTEPPRSDVAAAMDRLEARTSNLRIVRERVRSADPPPALHRRLIAADRLAGSVQSGTLSGHMRVPRGARGAASPAFATVTCGRA